MNIVKSTGCNLKSVTTPGFFVANIVLPYCIKLRVVDDAVLELMCMFVCWFDYVCPEKHEQIDNCLDNS